MEHIMISGFADEISSDFDEQLRVVASLGMRYISLRTANGKGIAEYTAGEAADMLLPKLKAAGIKVSSLGSPMGKIQVDSQEEFEKQLIQLEELCSICKILDCHYIRMFSFYIPKGLNPDDYKETVIHKLMQFEKIARAHGVILIHENEKDIYGDTRIRCKTILDTLNSPYFKGVFDPANFVQCGEDPLECWELLHDQIAYIHIKDAVSDDNQNVPCGTGEGKIKEILTKAIVEEGYQGFLTLEPHLVLFDALSSLETESAGDIIKTNKAEDGVQGYAIQYHGLMNILDTIN